MESKFQRDEREIEELLESLHPNPTQRFYARMAGAPWMGTAPSSRANTRNRFLALSLLVLLLTLAVFALTPQGRALAGHVFEFFARAGSTSFPLPSEQVKQAGLKPTIEPTIITTLRPVETVLPTALGDADAYQAGEASDCYSTKEDDTYRCQINTAEAEVGFDAMEFPDTPHGFYFTGVQSVTGELVSLIISYSAIGGGGDLSLSQGLGEFPVYSEWSAVPPEAVQSVRVGGNPGEWVHGMFVVKEGAEQAVWEPDAPVQRLRWRVGERWIELSKMGDPVPIEWLDREELIILAESLVLQPDDRLAELNPDHLTRVEDAEKLAGFVVKEPALLPEGFVFTYAQWDADAPFIKLVYELGGKSGVAGIVIFQSRLTDVKAAEVTPEDYPPGVLELVQVGGTTGTYLAGSWWAAPMPDGAPTPGPTPTLTFRPDDPTRSLAWKADGLDIQILYYAGTNYGGRLDKEAMIRIAESMR